MGEYLIEIVQPEKFNYIKINNYSQKIVNQPKTIKVVTDQYLSIYTRIYYIRNCVSS